MQDIEKQAKQQRIIDLKWKLTSLESDIGDWKVAKIQESALMGLPAPYDMKDLHAKRQAVRDEINQLQVEVAAM